MIDGIRFMGTESDFDNMILLKKSFSQNQKKIFRTQMPYNERSEVG